MTPTSNIQGQLATYYDSLNDLRATRLFPPIISKVNKDSSEDPSPGRIPGQVYQSGIYKRS